METTHIYAGSTSRVYLIVHHLICLLIKHTRNAYIYTITDMIGIYIRPLKPYTVYNYDRRVHVPPPSTSIYQPPQYLYI